MSDYRHDDDAIQAPFDEDAYWGGEYEDDMEDYYYDDDMDGDHDSTMDSIGWGTDEDYGFYGYEEY